MNRPAQQTVHHNLLQISELIVEQWVSGGLLVAASGLYAITAAGIVALARRVLPANPSWVTYAVVAGLVLLAAPVHNRVRRWLDGRFERSSPALETVNADLDVSTVSASSLRLFCGDVSPAQIGPYEIERLLGEGAHALVYLGTKDGRRVAIKVANEKARTDSKLRERFRREAAILAELHHPNVAPIVELGSEGQEPYLAVEYFPEGTLRDRLQRDDRLPEDVAVAYAVDTARGLQAALELGVVHRDVNPRNILLDNGRASVGDFGIARCERECTITTHSQMLGTPCYVSPEVCAGEAPDWRADQYALGITLYEMLAGRRPFRAARVFEMVAMHLHSPVPDVRTVRPEVSSRTAAAIRRMMAKKPELRFRSYRELIDGLLDA